MELDFAMQLTFPAYQTLVPHFGQAQSIVRDGFVSGPWA
jgi:hypothetical protein